MPICVVSFTSDLCPVSRPRLQDKPLRSIETNGSFPFTGITLGPYHTARVEVQIIHTFEKTMEKDPPMNPGFEYSSLARVSEQIRLVKLLPQSQNNPHIAAEFLPPVSLSSAAPYEALSSTWGEKKLLSTIQLDRRDFNVTPNLLAALTALQYADKPRTPWIDAICIDQDDDADKEYQVSFMGRIYT
jgi:hypothetical protein